MPTAPVLNKTSPSCCMNTQHQTNCLYVALVSVALSIQRLHILTRQVCQNLPLFEFSLVEVRCRVNHPCDSLGKLPTATAVVWWLVPHVAQWPGESLHPAEATHSHFGSILKLPDNVFMWILMKVTQMHRGAWGGKKAVKSHVISF